MPKPENIIGIHYFNPAHIIPLVEIHRGSATSDAAFEETKRLMEASGKKTVLVRKEVPGFIVNRIMGAINARSTTCSTKGICTPEDLDIAIKSSTGFRFACLGPMEVEDMIGLDISVTVSGRVFTGLSNATGPSPTARGEGREGANWASSRARAGTTTAARRARRSSKEKNRLLLPQLKLFLTRQ